VGINYIFAKAPLDIFLEIVPMLELFTKHGLFDLEINASGDTDIDFHHTVEDIGICLGEAFNKALGTKEKIKRYGEAKVPMDEALAQITLDISGRPHLTCNIPQIEDKVGQFDTELVAEFFSGLCEQQQQLRFT